MKTTLMHKFIPMSEAMKILDAKAAEDKGWNKVRDDPSIAIGECQEQEGGHSKSTKRQKRKSHFVTLMDICHQ